MSMFGVMRTIEMETHFYTGVSATGSGDLGDDTGLYTPIQACIVRSEAGIYWLIVWPAAPARKWISAESQTTRRSLTPALNSMLLRGGERDVARKGATRDLNRRRGDEIMTKLNMRTASRSTRGVQLARCAPIVRLGVVRPIR